jgi:curli production assembly/transport component CsgF
MQVEINAKQGLILLAMAVGLTVASELVYVPVNPSFGGNPYNSQWLLSCAQSQNSLTEKSSADLLKQDPLEEFKESLNRQILSRFSSEIVQAAFGESEDDLQEGHYQIGDYTIDVKPLSSNIRVEITDAVTGNSTVIEVPYYRTGDK